MSCRNRSSLCLPSARITKAWQFSLDGGVVFNVDSGEWAQVLLPVPQHLIKPVISRPTYPMF